MFCVKQGQGRAVRGIKMLNTVEWFVVWHADEMKLPSLGRCPVLTSISLFLSPPLVVGVDLCN